MFIENGSVNEEKWEANGVEFNKRQRGHQHMFGKFYSLHFF